MTIQVLLVDDHPAIRVGISSALGAAADIAIVGEASSGRDALDLLSNIQADVVLLDYRLPDMEGAEVAEEIRARSPSTRVLALSAYPDDDYVYAMLKAGAAGYLLKEEALDVIVAAVRAVANGEEWYSRPVMARVAAWARGEPAPPADASGLSDRELHVLRLMARGWENRRIAEELMISEGTVKNHVTNIYTKLDVRSRAEAVAWAWSNGLVREA